MNTLIDCLIGWPQRVARHLDWLGPLFARITVGYVFMLTGWGKLHSLPQVILHFAGWGFPYPNVLTPFVAGVEFIGGLFLILGLLTRVSAGALGIVMIVAIRTAKWGDIDSAYTLLGFEETLYLAIFLWLAIAGAGSLSIDHVLRRSAR
jgi:putative oxidoreductase